MDILVNFIDFIKRDPVEVLAEISAKLNEILDEEKSWGIGPEEVE